MDKTVSIIIPCYNEKKFISALLEDVLRQDYPPELTEVLVVDGISNDGTRDIIAQYLEKHSSIRLLDNEKRYVPFAMNLGIGASRGDIIIRMDAHTFYPANYISLLVKYLFELKADNVGAVLVNMPGNDTLEALAISKALSSPFGVGNAKFRTGIRQIQRADTVPFGCYRREIFEKIGLFDEELLRNQDDEFNARLLKNGGTIYLIPEITIQYFTRTSVLKLIKMYFQYGLFKPLVSYKIGRPTTKRQLVPLFFVLYLAVTLIGSPFSDWSLFFLLAGFGIYLLTAIFFSINIARKSKMAMLLYLPWLFFCIHISYGWGYLAGIFKFLLFRQKKRHVALSH